ncbi:GSCOCG00002677001-RA-CDS, partial [Cotesia congregata]
NVNFDHPGNWTDHKDYRTPDGAGQVHEEAGQLVNGGAQVRYYKKNYAATYGTGSNNLGLGHNLNSESLLQDDLLHSRNLGLQSAQNYGHEQSRLDSSRFQESTNTQLYNDRVNGASNDNWSRFNTYGVDGGRGKVYEEEGQYSQGPAKVRYYKKNYTSSYTSSGTPLVVPIITDVTNLESQAQRLESQLNQLSRDSHHSQSIHSDNSAQQTGYGQVYTQNNNPQHYDRPLSTEQRYQHTSQQHQTVKTGGTGYIPVQPVTHFNYVIPDTELENVQTSQHTNQQTVQTQQTHRADIDETHHNQQVGGIVRVPLHRNDYGSNVNTYREDSRTQETLAAEQALRNQLRDNIQYAAVQDIPTHSGRRVEEHWESNSRHRVESTIPHHHGQDYGQYGQDYGQYNQERGHGHSGYGQNYEQQSHRNENRHKHYGEDYGQRYRRDEYHHQDHDHKSHEGHPHQDDDRHRHLSRDNDFDNNGGHSHDHQSHEENSHQDNDRHRHSEGEHRYKRESRRYEDFDQQTNAGFGDLSQQTTGEFDFGQNTEKLALEKQNIENLNQEAQRVDFWHKQAKNLEFGQQTEDLSQQTHNFDFGQQTEDLSQQTHKFDDLSQHQSSGHEFDRHHHKLETGNLEFGQQTEDLSQQTHDFDFGQQTEDLSQQTHKFDDLSSHHSSGHDFDRRHHKLETGNLEFGQQTEDLSQQTHKFDDFHLPLRPVESHEFGQHHHELETGNLEFGQHTEDLSQQTHKLDDLSHHQSSDHEFDRRHHKLETGNLEFGQQTEDLSQQKHNFDFVQQTEDLSQQTHKLDDLSHHQSSDHEFDRRHHKLETGNLEFGQQTEDLSQQKHNFDFVQQTEDLSQQTHKLDDLSSHQSSGHEYDRRYHKLETGNLEFGQQTEDLSQQTHSFDFGQQTEDLSQQTHKLDDLSHHQSSSHEFDRRHHKLVTGNLEFGQQTEDLSQQSHKFDDFHLTLRPVESHELGQHHHELETGNFEFGQQTEDLSQQTHNLDDFNHHQSGTHEFDHHHHKLETGNLEFGQQTEDLSQQTHNFEFGQQTEDLSQQTHKLDDFNHHQVGTHEFDRHHHKLETGNLEFGQQTEDLSQQTHNFEFGQQTEDLSQQTHKLDDFSQHQSENHEILQVYGGKGPYKAGIQGDYSGVKPNPSATLEPQYYGNEPWEIREVASEKFSARSAAPLDTVPESTTPLSETTPSPGFWKKLGNKITTSYEKAKDKLSNTFG